MNLVMDTKIYNSHSSMQGFEVVSVQRSLLHDNLMDSIVNVDIPILAHVISENRGNTKVEYLKLKFGNNEIEEACVGAVFREVTCRHRLEPIAEEKSIANVATTSIHQPTQRPQQNEVEYSRL